MCLGTEKLGGGCDSRLHALTGLTMRLAGNIAIIWLAAQAAVLAGPKIDYLREIKPLFARRCYACHGALQRQAGLRLDTAEAMRRGGESGPAVERGKSADSLLIDVLTGAAGLDMPPRGEGKPLSTEEIAAIRRWIDEGAEAPADEEPQPDPKMHWAFQRIERPAVPVVNSNAVRNPIDAFIAAELEGRQLVAAAPASKPALLRRVSLDLIGLPPTPDEMHQFLADADEGAYERVVDRLLESPQYGERWARHWMDVWRYSDWYGRRAVPDVWNSAPQVWRWRDWIVRSHNDDKGYDRMVMEMLAGDEIAPEDEEAAVATGYIIRNWYALNAHQWMKDLVEHTGKAFLGLTLNCAHCHDHKYDPITNDDYFAFRAFFEPIQVRQDWAQGEPDPGPFQKYEYTVLRKVAKHGLVRIFDENLSAETRVYRQGDERIVAQDKPPVAPRAPAFLGVGRVAIEPVDLPVRAWYPGLKPFIQQAETDSREARVREALAAYQKTQQAFVAALENRAAIEVQRQQAIATAPVPGRQVAALDPRLADRLNESRLTAQRAENAAKLAELQLATAQAQLDSIVTRIAADRGRYVAGAADSDDLARAAGRAERIANWRAAAEKEAAAEGERAAAQTQLDAATEGAARDKVAAALRQSEQQLAAARQAAGAAREAIDVSTTDYSPISPVYPVRSSGRRRALADWIASRDNPLTARVAVNHIWLRHLGRALVESPADFGINGKKPSHPQLLDWLAMELMEGSNVPSTPSTGAWRMKHLHRLIVTSSTYRTSSDRGLDPETLARDPENRWYARSAPRRMEAEVVRDSILLVAGQLDPTLGGPPIENDQESRRRSLYFAIHPEGGGHPQLLELFDAPDPCDCYKRTESLVPQQALALANGPLAQNGSRHAARRMWAQATQQSSPEQSPAAGRTEFITAAFEAVLSREPSAAEAAACAAFLEKQQALFAAEIPASSPTANKGNAIPPAADPALRAAENLVHVLFNHNEFITIR